MSETTPEVAFALALLEVQASLPHFSKDAKATVKNKDGTPNYSYDYADLTTITDAALPILNKFGFSFICKPHLREDDRFVLRYVLLHSAGHSETGDYPLGTGNAQQIGSAITYGRRYCLCAVTGIAPAGEDDDGAKASEPRQAPSPNRETDPVWLEDVEQRITFATTLTDLAAIRTEANHKYEKFALDADDAKRLKVSIETREAEIKGQPA